MSKRTHENPQESPKKRPVLFWLALPILISILLAIAKVSDLVSGPNDEEIASHVLPVLQPASDPAQSPPEEKLPGEDGVFKRPLWVTPKHMRMRSRPASKSAVPAQAKAETKSPKANSSAQQSASQAAAKKPKALAHRPKTNKYPKNIKKAPTDSPKSQAPLASGGGGLVIKEGGDAVTIGNGSGTPGGPGIQSELSWDSIPSSGPPMNGHLKVKITPPTAPGSKKRVKRNLVVLIDVSGSMGVSTERIATPVSLMMQGLNADDRAVVVAFSDRAMVFQSDTSMATYQRELPALTRARSTNLRVGLETAIKELKKGKQHGRVNQFVVLTDGLTHVGSKHYHRQTCVSICKEARVPVDVLGYGRNHDAKLLGKIARASGGKYTHVRDVGLLLESVLGDVLGLSGVSTRDNVLILKLAPGVQSNQAFILGRNGRKLGAVRVVNREVRIPLGDLREGEEIEVVLEVLLPRGEVGISEIAKARVEYQQADGQYEHTSESKIHIKYSESWETSKKNPRMKDVLFETQNASKK